MMKAAKVLISVVIGLQGSALWAQSSLPVPVVDRSGKPAGNGALTANAVNAAGRVPAPVVIAQSAQQSQAAELLILLDQLQQEVQFLRGKVEEQAHQMKKMRTSQRDRYRDLDRRITNLTRQLAEVSAAGRGSVTAAQVTPKQSVLNQPASSVPASRPSPATSTTVPGLSDREAYQRAFALVRQRSYAKSLLAFDDFVKQYPSSPLVPNAVFWTGEVHRAQTDYTAAEAAYKRLIERFPKHQKAADAYYKLGLTYDLMGDRPGAAAAMKKVIELYPNQSSAKLADDYLKKNLNN
ncbi:tol-pal system protein YbgF [Motiliproteus sp. MSK22-1]|uniref:tol-pal system protein YbgF n=1 Tax=Motiliproteus sp. MSK22-1 TaxID=1897630 RepID=UPI000976739E|nr:tol-pal system protein YbgF [Motiliproteus sp. MSK22-1]OMH38772.1 tol-pal system protein YbgF [Motiliproteus sp. MSK22-1]